MQTMGCCALQSLTKALSSAGQQAAAEAGAIEATLNAIRDASASAGLGAGPAGAVGLAALTSLCYGYDAAMLRAIEGGALRAAVAAMRAHPQDEGLQLTGAQVLIDFGKL